MNYYAILDSTRTWVQKPGDYLTEEGFPDQKLHIYRDNQFIALRVGDIICQVKPETLKEFVLGPAVDKVRLIKTIGVLTGAIMETWALACVKHVSYLCGLELKEQIRLAIKRSKSGGREEALRLLGNLPRPETKSAKMVIESVQHALSENSTRLAITFSAVAVALRSDELAKNASYEEIQVLGKAADVEREWQGKKLLELLEKQNA